MFHFGIHFNRKFGKYRKIYHNIGQKIGLTDGITAESNHTLHRTSYTQHKYSLSLRIFIISQILFFEKHVATEFGFASLKFIYIAFNIQKMVRFSHEASCFDLRSQITDALDKCRFLRSIREVFGLQNTDLDLSDDEMSDAQVSSKYRHSFILLVFIARLLHKIVRCTWFLSPLKNWSYPESFSFPSLHYLLLSAEKPSPQYR